MNKSQLKINCYFPEVLSEIKDKQGFVNSIMEMMRQDGNVKRAGYFSENDFQKDLLYHMGDESIAQYKPLISNQKRSIEELIHSTIEKCHKVLPHPDLPVFIFVYPWFPDKDNQKLFQGTTAFATYYTMHLFIDLNFFTEASLKQTVAHEWSHLVYYRYHDEQKCSLLDHIIMEGFAEVFREEIVNGGAAPWSVALDEKESLRQLKLIEVELNSASMELYKKVFWGDSEHKRWTGYSIGYNIVKKFRKIFPKLTWKNIIKTRSQDIIIRIKKK